MKINYYRILLAFIDIALVNIAFLLALLVRFEGPAPAEYYIVFRQAALPITFINLSFFYAFGLYNQIWAYASISALILIIDAVSCGALFSAIYLWVFAGGRMPYSVIIIAALIKLLLVGGGRFTWRVAREKLIGDHRSKKKKALIVGAGDAGESIVREMLRSNGSSAYFPAGFIDDDRSKEGMVIHGIKVVGNRRDIPKLVKTKGIDEVILAIPSASGDDVRDIHNICKSVNVRSKTLPAIYELINGQVSVNLIRDINEEDLLKRKPVKFDFDEIKKGIEEKTILITGAGGSIGSELSRQIARCGPKKLVLLGQGENSIYNIDMELKEIFRDIEVVPVIANIRDKAKMQKVMAIHHPDIIFHAAAYKHVGMMEMNPDEAYINNVTGTKNVAEASIEHGVDKFVLVSTDKAVDPTSVMGQTKHQAELIVLGLQGSGKTRFIVTRFGNVMNSRGSVIPLFKKQISEGRPVTVTHPDVVRFFMTIPEAVQLVIRAALMGEGGEIFVLDMGEPVRIVDLARELIKLSGLEPGRDVPIKFTGLKPGEKMMEYLTRNDEEIMKTSHEKIWKVRQKVFANS
jgi:FlaA1/EpsC-like NDP-sugar epimerase